jgi:hypothetical protein
VPLLIWGWSIADAANVASGGMHRPHRGWTLGFATSTYHDLVWDARSVSFEWYPTNRIAIGLSDLGVANDRGDATRLAYTGAVRTMVILSRGRHWQPALVGLGGVIVPQSPPTLVAGETLAPPEGPLVMLGGGFDLRYYATPRYFLEIETGGRSLDQDWTWQTRLGLGVHFGR